MTLALSRTVFADGERRSDDYEVRHNGRTIGRILRLGSTGRELWQWTQIQHTGAELRPERWRGGYIGRGQGRVPADVRRLRRI